MAVVGVAALLAACGGDDSSAKDGTSATSDGGSGPKGDPIQIGAALELTGANSILGLDAQDGAKLAVKELNDDGGVLGRPLRLKVVDNETKPDTATEVATRLVEDDGIVMLLNAVSSATALAISNTVSKPNDLLLMNAIASANQLVVENFQPNIFSLAPNSIMESRTHAARVCAMGVHSVATVAADYAAGHANTDVFVQYIKDNCPSVKITSSQFHPLTETDYSSYVNRLLSEKPELIYYLHVGDALINFTKTAKSAGLLDQTKVMGFYDTTSLGALGADIPVGNIGMGRAPFYALDGAAAKDAVERFHTEYGHYPSEWALSEYDAVMVWAAAVEKAGDTDVADVSAALLKDTFTTTRGDVTFRSIDHQASVPVFFGTIAASIPTYDIPGWTDVEKVDTTKYMPAEAEVNQRRGSS
jgi:branched-chain amino acid transport system substrate-binding protein